MFYVFSFPHGVYVGTLKITSISDPSILTLPGIPILFILLIQNIYFGCSYEPSQRGGSNVYPKSMFGQIC